MSQHEVEELVELSVRALAASGRPQQELRSLYWNLFEYEGLFDTGFTQLRTIDDLVAARFVYKMALDEHPDFFAQREYFTELKGVDGRSATFVEPPDKGMDGSYYKLPHLYCPVASSLWQRLVELGRLTGPDAEPPRPIEITTIALDVARLAERNSDPALIGMWYRLLLPQAFERDLEELQANPTLAELRALVKRTDALAIKTDYGMLRDPPPEDRDEIPVLGWWFDLA
jgi:hypothetical protein